MSKKININETILPESIKDIKPEITIKKSHTFFKKIKFCFLRFWYFSTAKPNEKENVIQYLFRQFIITDSSGNPSWTVTSLFFVLVLLGITTYIEYLLALSPVITYTPEGKVATWQLKGLSTEYYYVILSLSVIVTGLFRARQKDQNGETSLIDNVTDTAVNLANTAKEAISKIIKK